MINNKNNEIKLIIPKIIHYCWFGKGRMSSLQKKCIKSWKSNLPDYEFKLWDETNTNLDHPFLIKAYREKKWAFVADLVRLKVLYDIGGIYLDTDMLLCQNLNSFLKYPCFFGSEDVNHISCGIIGAQARHTFIKECISKYDHLIQTKSIEWSDISIPKLVTQIFRENYDYRNVFNSKIYFDDLTIFPSIYFYSLPYSRRLESNIDLCLDNNKIYAVHLWDESWIDLDSNTLLQKRKFGKALSKMQTELNYKENYNLEYFLNRLKTIRRLILSTLK
jgi:hypothetical protein